MGSLQNFLTKKPVAASIAITLVAVSAIALTAWAIKVLSVWLLMAGLIGLAFILLDLAFAQLITKK